MGPHGLLVGATGSGKSELLRTLVLALAVDAQLGDPQLRPGRLQGRRDLRHARPAAAHQRGDHQPGGRAAAGRPDARRDQRRADPPAGAAAQGRQLRLAARLRAGPRRRRPAGAAAQPADHLRRVQRAAHRQARTSSTCSCRSAGSAGRSGVHLLLASQRLEEGRLRGLDTHLSYRIGLRTFSAMESRARARRRRRLRAAPLARPRLPQVRHRGADAVPGRLRLRPLPPGRRAAWSAGRRATDAGASVHDAATWRSARVRRADAAARRAGRQRPPTRAVRRRDACSTSWSTGCRARACRRTRSGCRRWTSRRRSTSCCPPLGVDAERGLTASGPDLHGALHGVRRHRRQAVRAAPRPAVARPVGRGRPRRRGRRPAERQEHAAAHAWPAWR